MRKISPKMGVMLTAIFMGTSINRVLKNRIEISRNITEAATATGSVSNDIAVILQSSKNIKKDIHGMDSGIKETAKNSTETDHSSEDLLKISVRLYNSVSSFKIDHGLVARLEQDGKESR